MSRPDQILDILQADIVASLKHAATIPHAKVFTGAEEDFETRIEKALATKRTDAGGKRGLAIQVLPIAVPDSEGDLPGPPLKLKVQVLIVENLTANRSASHGTLMTTSQAAINVLSFLQLRSFGRSSLYAEKNPITPYKIEPGFGAHIVTVFLSNAGGDIAPKVSPVTDSWIADIAPGDAWGPLTITGITDSGSPSAIPQLPYAGMSNNRPLWTNTGQTLIANPRWRCHHNQDNLWVCEDVVLGWMFTSASTAANPLELEWLLVSGPFTLGGSPILNATPESPGALQLSCADGDAEIYYTTDGTYPSPTTSQLYSAPITGLEPGDLVRSAAYVDGKDPSDVLETNLI